MSASTPSGSGDPSTGLPTAHDLLSVTGPLQVGMLLNWGLMGLFVHQVYVYSTNYARTDRPLFRYLVYSVLILEVMFSVTSTHLVHYMLIDGWGNPEHLTFLPWSATFLTPSSSTIACIVQCFFAWRVWRLNADSIVLRVVTAFVPLVALLQFCSGISLSIVWYRHGLNLPESRSHFNHEVLVLIDLVAAVVGDVLVTALLVLSLLRARTKTKAVRTTTELCNRLIIRAVETGAVTSIVAIIGLSLYTHPKFVSDAYYATPALCLGKFYSTMLMTNLNGRGYFSGANQQVSSINVSHLNNDYDVDIARRPSFANRQPQGILVSTQVEHEHYGSELDVKSSKSFQ